MREWIGVQRTIQFSIPTNAPDQNFRTMMVSPHGVRVLVVTRPVDFRKSHDGLAAVVQEELGLDPYSGVVYVFPSSGGERTRTARLRRCTRQS